MKQQWKPNSVEASKRSHISAFLADLTATREHYQLLFSCSSSTVFFVSSLNRSYYVRDNTHAEEDTSQLIQIFIIVCEEPRRKAGPWKIKLNSFSCSPPRKSLVKGERFMRIEGNSDEAYHVGQLSVFRLHKRKINKQVLKISITSFN